MCYVERVYISGQYFQQHPRLRKLGRAGARCRGCKVTVKGCMRATEREIGSGEIRLEIKLVEHYPDLVTSLVDICMLPEQQSRLVHLLDKCVTIQSAPF